MNDEKQEFDYLLDDDEFARVMNYRYGKEGKPRDRLAEQRIGKRLGFGKKGRHPVFYSLFFLAAAALLLLFVRPAVQDESQPQVKTAVPDLDVRLEWNEDPGEPGVRVQTFEPRLVVIYASDDQGQRHRIHEPFQLQAEELRMVPVSPDLAQSWKRICVLTAENVAELERLESMLDLLWAQMSERQCVTR